MTGRSVGAKEVLEMGLTNSVPTGTGPSQLLTSKPIIKAVSGYAVAGSMELALMFDLKVMEESAIMGIFGRRFALGQSLKLAQIAKFPRHCMNVDRRSAYYSTFDAESWDAALQYEFKNGMKVIQDEGVPGAASFVKAIEKHGLFNGNKPSKL